MKRLALILIALLLTGCAVQRYTVIDMCRTVTVERTDVYTGTRTTYDAAYFYELHPELKP